MRSIKFGKTLRYIQSILRPEWKICSRSSQNLLEPALRSNSRRTMSGNPPSLMLESNWTNACVSLRDGRIEWLSWLENFGKASQFSISGRESLSLIHILITWSSESMKYLNFDPSMMNFWDSCPPRNKSVWMLTPLSTPSARSTLSIPMNIRRRTGPRPRQSMRRSLSLWRRKYAKSLGKRSSLRSWLLRSCSESSRGGRVSWVRTLLRRSCRLRETVSLSSLVETFERPRRSSRQGLARVLNKYREWRSHPKPITCLMSSQPLSGLVNFLKRYSQIKRSLKVYSVIFLLCRGWIKNAKIFANTSRTTRMDFPLNGTIPFLRPSMIQTRSKGFRWAAS